MEKRILAILPVHNRKKMTLSIIAQLKMQAIEGGVLEILVIDDGSTDGTATAVEKKHPDVTLVRGDGDLWWAGGVNRGFEHALSRGVDFVYVLNDDNRLEPETLQKLIDTAEECPMSVCASVCLSIKDKTVLSAGERYRGPLRNLHILGRGANPDDLPACMEAEVIGSRSTLIPLECVKKIGFFNDHRFPQHYSDLDYFSRARKAGYCLQVITGSRVYTQPNKNYFHRFLAAQKLPEILAAYRNKRYPFYYRTLYFSSFCDRPWHIGCLYLGRMIIKHMLWLFLRVVLGAGGISSVIRLKGLPAK